MSTSRPHPVGGVDYPRTLQEFDEWFGTEEGCSQYLGRLRWPEGFQCPGCGGPKAWLTKRNLFHCAQCQQQTSLTAGTLFAGTRKPLRVWFHAMWYLTSQKSGVSALGFQRALGLGSYQTAWAWLHKLRRAMVRPGREFLHGCVEIDESYVGGVESGVKGRQTEDKAIVVIAVEVLSPKGFGRVRLRQIPDVSGPSLLSFVREVVAPGAELVTDSWRGYNGLSTAGFIHQKHNISASGDPAHVLLPGPHRVASLLKRWLLGMHQGAVRREHLDYYLDEFTFRFNRRTSHARGLLFHRLMEQAAQIEPTTYRGIIGGKALPSPDLG